MTFTSFERAGLRTERGTEGIAASWNTTSTPPIAWRNASGSRMVSSISTISPARYLRLSREPVAKSSSTRTRWPTRTSPSTRWAPINPAPPVTNTCMRALSLLAYLLILPASRLGSLQPDDIPAGHEVTGERQRVSGIDDEGGVRSNHRVG